MGQCLNGARARARRPQLKQSHFHSQFVNASDKDKDPRQKRKNLPQNMPEASIDSVWISRGMPTVRPKLTEFNRRIVKESWAFLDPNMVNIGRIVFKRLFVTIPPIKELFLKRHNLTNPHEAFTIKKHAERVMLAVAKVIKNLDEPYLLEVFLHELGGRHAVYNVRIEYFDCFIPFFIQAIHPVLKEKWASSIEDAWAAFFRRTIHVMKEAVVF